MRRALPELLRSRGQGAPSLQPSLVAPLEAGHDGRGSAAAAAAAAAGPGGEEAAVVEPLAASADSRSEDVLLRALQAQQLQHP